MVTLLHVGMNPPKGVIPPTVYERSVVVAIGVANVIDILRGDNVLSDVSRAHR